MFIVLVGYFRIKNNSKKAKERKKNEKHHQQLHSIDKIPSECNEFGALFGGVDRNHLEIELK